MSRDATTSFARTLVDEWARDGVTEACLAPGSRSAPLALALADDERIRLHVHLDERSASFFALGLARVTGHPAVVLCTSGTAAANFHPAVLEAHHGRVPMIVCTADRPPESRDTGAGQTVDQLALYRGAVRWFHEAGVPDDHPGAGDEWRSMAARAVADASGPPAGPVHLNLPFREPLVPTGEPLVDAPGRGRDRPWTTRAPGVRTPSAPVLDELADLVRRAPRGLVVAGWGADAAAATVLEFGRVTGWPVLADPISNLRVPGVVSTYDPLLRGAAFAATHRPEAVLRVGGPLTNKVAMQWLDAAVEQVLVDPDRAWLDPQHAASARVLADPEPVLAGLTSAVAGMPTDDDWCAGWSEAEKAARAAIDALVDGWREPFEGRAARDVVASLPAGAALVLASSMPVRDAESFAAPRTGMHVHANRGVNGIDGFVSTVLGVAAGHDGPTVGLVGDLCFLHDSTGLLGANSRGVDATFVVVDNDGGGIFSFLPQADLPRHFETVFGTPHGIDLAALTRVHGIPVVEITEADDLAPAVVDATAAGGVRVVLVRTDRATNVTRHRAVWSAVAAAI